ncbi:extracellular solute-binding protein [Cognatishimia sp. 1_MG-2023]|uniref:ABC transporter substrate-binding protein n=1 Tax=Cognatishimia sp. 1_MG-2023 TaxID=3062642 RepID=UPI0026E36882|nr:extracellular solute-binding protein [Cognatishimia sp. 1_MG-2023]MDO6727708.1 extracellular solute-binding protein [Cognatishimia sp. 1_MG-2023]
MKRTTHILAGLLASTVLAGAVSADTIRFWTMEVQPERIAVQEKMAAGFEAASGHSVEIIPVEESDIQTRATAAFAAGDLPDVINLTVSHILPYSEAGLLDTAAASEVMDNLGVDSFAEGPVSMAMSDGEIVAVPSDGWTQLIVYRADLFKAAGLEAPTTFDAMNAAMKALHNPPSMYGFVAATKIDEGYMMQLIEHLSLATGYSPVNADGSINEDTTHLVELLELYQSLVTNSPDGDLYWSQSRELYLDGKAAMVIWSPSILDELGGLRDSAPVTINDDPTTTELAGATGFSTVISGPGNADGSAYADVRYLGITADANTGVAQEFVEYVMSEGYGQWLSQAPEGKFPVRRGTEAGDTSFEVTWAGLDVGVDRKAPLGEIYPQSVIDDIVAGLSVGDRWGVADGQLATASKIVNSQIMSRVIREMTDGDLSVQEAADKIVAEHKALDL